ncbi:hypothetical protein [Methanogenium cariaci]|uniref:hypothetical protein n=1 Tax=Methanogenium cariaci TaxID=2197 RepID=UPI0024814ACF|nr:hypothetical protein [Methanogenium cariaci]
MSEGQHPLTFCITESSDTPHVEKAFVLKRPAHWTGYPMDACSSTISVWSPKAAQYRAAADPAGPAPTTITSYITNQ